MDNPPVGTLLDFGGRVAIVTGGGVTLGAGIALRFAEAGATLVVNYNTSEAGARDVVARIEAAGGRAVAAQADVSQRGDVERLLAQAVEAFGRVDVLVNNAGTYPLHALLDMRDEDWEHVINANLRSVHLCTQVVARQMVAQGNGGAIVNVATIEAENPAPNHAHYNAAKGGVIMHTRAAAYELGPHDIRVNAVSPGLIWREGLKDDWPEGVDRYERAAPLGRVGLPAEVADACLFLASPAARWITGANLRVDGGVMTNRVF